MESNGSHTAVSNLKSYIVQALFIPILNHILFQCQTYVSLSLGQNHSLPNSGMNAYWLFESSTYTNHHPVTIKDSTEADGEEAL